MPLLAPVAYAGRVSRCTIGATCLLLGLLAAACGSDEAFRYEVYYTDPRPSLFDDSKPYDESKAYDEERDGAPLRDCLRQDGASLHSTKLSFPPIPIVVFKGGEGDRKRFERCLRAIPGTRVEGPRRLVDKG